MNKRIRPELLRSVSVFVPGCVMATSGATRAQGKIAQPASLILLPKLRRAVCNFVIV